jgi:sugar-specific transcriptional regulator TrmB
MIIQKHFLNKLKDFGLNTYEGKLWTALLSRGVSTAGELSDIANVPRSRSYDVLESLEKKGFIIMKVGKPIKYIAVPPEEVIERVKKKIKETAETQSNMLEGLKDSEVLSELNSLHTQGIDLVEPSDLTGSLKGRPALYNHIEMMVKGAKKSIIIMTSSEGLARKSETLKNVLQKAHDRGVKIRIAAPLDNNAKKAAASLEGVAEVRHIDSIKSRFCIVDENQMAFMLLDDKKVHPTYDTAIWANTDFFASSLQSFFDNEWDKLKPLKKIVKA